MTLRKFHGDLGNNEWKGKLGDAEISIPNMLVEITKSNYEKAKKIGGNTLSPDYVIVNDKYYVVGESAERHSTQKPLIGAAKYSEKYIGIAAPVMIARLSKTDCDVIYNLAYPPGNADFTDALESSIQNDYTVTLENRTVHIHTDYNPYMFCEPVGGAMNVLLTKEGTLRKNIAQHGRILVIDFGGGTTDFQGLFPDGKLDPAIQDSLKEGISGVYDRLRQALETEYAGKLIAGNAGISQDRLRRVLKTGFLNLKGTDYDCRDLVALEKTSFLNRFSGGYSKYAFAGTQSDCIILTGAGYVDIFEDVLPILDFNPEAVYKAEDDKFAHLANVRGGANQFKMFEDTGVITYE